MLSLKDQIICKAVLAHKRLTIIGKLKNTGTPKSQVAVTYKRFKLQGFDRENFAVQGLWSLIGGSHLGGVVTHGGSIIVIK